MSISRLVPPLDYLRAASRTSLQSFELARLNHAANLRREIAILIDQWIQETSQATLARWMLDHHETHCDSPIPAANVTSTFLESPFDLLPGSPPLTAEVVSAPPRFSGTRLQNEERIRIKSQKQRATSRS
jgi:hypothetical protein